MVFMYNKIIKDVMNVCVCRLVIYILVLILLLGGGCGECLSM